MALYGPAIKKLIKPGANDPRIHAVGMVFHVAVSKSDSLHDFFATKSGGIESHFYVREDGTVEQYRDTAFEADAQSKGNSFFRDSRTCGYISVETEGMGEGKWAPAQIKALLELGNWARKEHGFKRERATGPMSDGYGYHAMHNEWNPNRHSCPGPDRIKQFNTVLLPALTAPHKPTRVELANALLKDAQIYAEKHGMASRAKAIKKKIATGPGK